MTVLKTAEWIFADCDGKIDDRYFIYKDTFCVKTKEQTTVHIAAHSKYALYVNGEFVDCGQYADYEEYQVYDTLDISGFLKEGKMNWKSDSMSVAKSFLRSVRPFRG